MSAASRDPAGEERDLDRRSGRLTSDALVMLDPFGCTRFEMAAFAAQARELGVEYVGICCGAGPHHVRAMAEALGRKVPASKYSPSMELHPMFRRRSRPRTRHSCRPGTPDR
jgi:hypothetical protein